VFPAHDVAPLSNSCSEVLLKMRRLTILLALMAATAATAACAASAPPGWTYAPAPSATPIPSGSASGSPTASSSAAPNASASARPSASPTGSAGASPSAGASGEAGATITVTAPVGASTSGFDPKTVETAADTPFTLVFDNQDTGVLHNLVLKNPDGSKVQVSGDTAFFNGPGERTHQVPALAAGDYPFMCEVHPVTMTGTLTVK
jgi:plastocyanin